MKIMKKILFWSAVAMFAAVSCNKLESDAPVAESNVPSFFASVDGADTKTVIDGKKSYWDGTEAIRVFDGKVANGKVYEATVQKSQTAKFVEKDAKVSIDGDDYLAVYPEGPAGSVTWDGNVTSPAKKFWLPGDQTAVAGSYDPSTHIAVAYTEAGNTNLEYKNVTALVKVTVANEKVSEICFYGNSQEKITGNFDVLYNEGNPTASFATGYTQNTYAKIAGTIEKGSTYYISILPTVFEKGFSIEFVIDGIKYTKTLSSKYTVERNQIIDLPVAEFQPQVVATKTIYVLPNSAWISAKGRYAVYCWGTDAAATWYDMTDADGDGVYQAEVPVVNENVIFCCMSASATANNWNNKLEQTADLTMPTTDNNCYIVHESKWNTVEYAKTYKEPVVEDVKKLYLKPNSNWTQANARFAAYFFGNGERWVSMTASDVSGIYEVPIPTDKNFPKVIFCRMNPSAAANNWNNKWNQTGDLTIPTDGRNLFTLPSGVWDGSTSTWSTK
jgi:hypothetical protein